MRKMILSLGLGILATTTILATNGSSKTTATVVCVEKSDDNTNTAPAANTVAEVYKQIDFNGNKISFEAFSKAYKGYTSLKNAGKLRSGKNIITIADFSLSSGKNRLWVIDLAKKKVLFNTLVAHGQGSGNAMATSFSNTGNSHQSSLGFYVTGDTYCGKHGCSLRLNGMDKGFNDQALSRAVVMHSAAYVSQARAKCGSIGRSWGCPAVSPQMAGPIINTIQGGTCLFIYAPQQKYLQSSQWLNA